MRRYKNHQQVLCILCIYKQSDDDEELMRCVWLDNGGEGEDKLCERVKHVGQYESNWLSGFRGNEATMMLCCAKEAR
jgi:hypothetical protein